MIQRLSHPAVHPDVWARLPINRPVTFKSVDLVDFWTANFGIGMIAERRHTAIAIYTNGIGYLKALDAEKKRSSLSLQLPAKAFASTLERYQ